MARTNQLNPRGSGEFLVKKGSPGPIVWINKAFTNHTATSEDDGKTFDTGEIKAGESSSAVKFDKEGEINYRCKIHGKTMSGTIVVKAAKGE